MKNTKIMIYIMIAVLIAGAGYLYATGQKSEGVLKGLDPESYDIAATCTKVEENILVCNEGNDQFLVLSGTNVYMERVKRVIEENGDEKTTVTYNEASVDILKKKIKENGSAWLKLWMTPNGKVDCIMITDETIENNNRTLSELEGLDLNKYSSENIVLDISEKGIKLAPANYSDENKDKLQEFVRTYPLTDKTRFYHIDIKQTIKDDKVESQNTQYAKYDFAKTKEALQKEKKVYVWFNESGNLDAVMTMNVETLKK